MSTIDTIDEQTALANLPTPDAILTWSDDRRKEFCKTFENRVNVAQRILLDTANHVLKEARKRHFISVKAAQRLENELGEVSRNCRYDYHRNDRDVSDVVAKRVRKVIDTLPDEMSAVTIIDPETANKIKQRDEYEDKIRITYDKLQELPVTYELDDPNYESMTVAEFRAMVKNTVNERANCIDLLREYKAQYDVLDKQIAIKLYSGLPGLSDAVVSVVKTMLTRAKDFGPTMRRVHETVMFGDSIAATTLLAGFEKDEQTVSDEYLTTLRDGLEALKLGKKPTKAKGPTPKGELG